LSVTLSLLVLSLFITSISLIILLQIKHEALIKKSSKERISKNLTKLKAGAFFSLLSISLFFVAELSETQFGARVLTGFNDMHLMENLGIIFLTSLLIGQIIFLNIFFKVLDGGR